MTTENTRLKEACDSGIPWRRWGPYLSERQWGTVREDYGTDGNSWAYLPHDHARSRAYRWGEDGLLGICDQQQRLCFGLALWNGNDPILKERLFGLTNDEGSHGEDCKEYYYYLDSTPTHSYMKGLYKYPQSEYPYNDLVHTNAARHRTDHEYELIDTGVFDQQRYFDVFVEYAKGSPEDILIQISIVNRGPEPATLRLLPTLLFRNTWSWYDDAAKPRLEAVAGPEGVSSVKATHPETGDMVLYCEGAPDLRFVENETNAERLFQSPNSFAYVKDGIHEFVIHGRHDAVNHEGIGTKVAADYELPVDPGATQVVRLRLVSASNTHEDPFQFGFQEIIDERRNEADEFYQAVIPENVSEDERCIVRQALGGMLWSKQFYNLDVESWLADRCEANRRNWEWGHLKAHDIISMPDKWEYPWFAVWDSGFHCLALMLVDVEFAKSQVSLFLQDRYLRDDGAIPAYEWAFGDVNPPVHAWATLNVYVFEKARDGKGDIEFLKWMYERLRRNFDWWIAQKGVDGRDVFEGGFLGLDNIGVFDRSSQLPTGGHIEQSDGTSWMVFYAQVMLRMSLELCRHDPSYEDGALYFFDRVLAISSAKVGGEWDSLWDEEDGFFYDVLRFPDGHATRLKIRSLVGLVPLAAVAIIEPETLAGLPRLQQKLRELYEGRGARNIHCPTSPGSSDRQMLAVMDEEKLRRVLSRMLDEEEFFSPYGIRSISRHHLDHPYVFHWSGAEYVVRYTPAESDSGMFGGNSNWRGPVWMPMNYLLLRALVSLYMYYGDSFKVECPTGSGKHLTLYEVSQELGRRLVGIFTRNTEGRRPVFGGAEHFQTDPDWQDHLLFYEYFHGDNGAGIGASHQTGWTGCVATVVNYLRRMDEETLKHGRKREIARKLVATSDRT